MQGCHHSYPKSAISGLKTCVWLRIRMISVGFWGPINTQSRDAGQSQQTWGSYSSQVCLCPKAAQCPSGGQRSQHNCLAPLSFLHHFPGYPRAKWSTHCLCNNHMPPEVNRELDISQRIHYMYTSSHASLTLFLYNDTCSLMVIL